MARSFLTWELVRGRFLQAIEGLDATQLNWRLHPRALTIGEMALHVAGVEVFFAAQLLGLELDPQLSRLSKAATDGVVNDSPFPFGSSEVTPELVAWSLEQGDRMVRPLLEDPAPWILEKQIVSALGPVIDGAGALARLAYHPGYHHGQAHLILTAPDFPKSEEQRG
ncbi:MAG: DinB family protein [Fimbriimonadales bacterium]|nr:DinB family protein [Fimbriimonadales bacterium]